MIPQRPYGTVNWRLALIPTLTFNLTLTLTLILTQDSVVVYDGFAARTANET
jgi:hypothetical protein